MPSLIRRRGRDHTDHWPRKPFRLAGTIAAGLALLSMSACSSSKPAASSATKTAVSGSATTAPVHLMNVSVGVYPGVIFSLMAQVALDQGLFQKNGLNPTFVSINGGPAIVSALESNSINFGENSYDNLLISAQNGLKIKAVVGNVSRMPFSIVVRSGIPTPDAGKPYPAPVRDLKGLKIGVPALNTSVEFFFKEMLADAGVPSTDETFVAVTPPTAIAALKAKQIDAYLGFEPIQTIAKATGVGKILLDLRTGQGPANFQDVPYNGWWATASYIGGHSQEVLAFQKTMEAASAFIHDPGNFAAVLKTATKVLPSASMTSTEFSTMVKNNLDTLGSGIPSTTIPAWDSLLTKSGLLKKSIPGSQVILASAPTS